jgi:GH3 auxin-responsive promoter
MIFANTLFKWFIATHYRSMARYLKHPHETQRQVWRDLVDIAAETVWGKKYGFAAIRTIDDFKNNVPVSDYDDLKPYIERMMHGESDVLWAGKVQWFSKSSGTTADKSKFIPVSQENLEGCHLKGGHDIMCAWYHNNPDTKLYDGKLMAMGGTHGAFEAHPATVIGDVSAIMMETMPFYAKFFFAPSLEVALMDEWETKIEKMATELSQADIRMISGVPTWMLVLLRRILAQTGKQNMLEVWPNFEFYAHGGVNFEPYRAQFQTFFPSETVRYLNVYNASEGFLAAQLENEGSDMTLLLENGIFFEFMPMAELGKPHPKTLQLDEVELDVNYALLISTNAGLWRYLIGDTVRFTSLLPYKIQISGRTKHFINVFGEEVMVENTDRALTLACAKHACMVREYTVAPIFMDADTGKGGHEWAIEFETPPTDIQAFADDLDGFLKQQNSDYEAKRYKSIALLPLKINVVPHDTFLNWLRLRGKVGGQHKVPRLSNSRQYLEALLG